MDNMYTTYNLKEIKNIINEAIGSEIVRNRLFEQKECKIINDLKVKLFDLFGIED